MKQVIGLMILINAIFVNTRSLQLEELANPCTPESLYSLKYYYPHPHDDSRYIECDPWGQMHVKACPENSKWNSWISSCVIQMPDNEEPKQMITNEAQTCTFYGNWKCQNGGFCNQPKCFCLSNFAGEFCEQASPSIGVFGQLINESFSLENYKLQRLELFKEYDLNGTIQMSFDKLVNNLVEDFLKLIYPNAFHLREFMLQSEVDLGYTSVILKLLQTAKYSFDNFDSFFRIFLELLDRLVEYLPQHVPNVQEEARRSYEAYLNHIKSNNISDINDYPELIKAIASSINEKSHLSRDEIKQAINDEFNETLSLSYNLFRSLNQFDDELSMKGVNYTNAQTVEAILNFTQDDSIIRLISQLNKRNVLTWDSLSYYGCIYVISSYLTPTIENITSTHMAYSMPGIEHISQVETKPADLTDHYIEESSFKHSTQPVLKTDEDFLTETILKEISRGLSSQFNSTLEPLVNSNFTEDEFTNSTNLPKQMISRRKLGRKGKILEMLATESYLKESVPGSTRVEFSEMKTTLPISNSTVDSEALNMETTRNYQKSEDYFILE